MTVSEAVKKHSEIFSSLGIETSLLDSRLIVMKATGFDKVKLFTESSRILTETELKTIEELSLRRQNFEPMQYIFGKCEFMGLDLSLNRDTLIPRADTEILVETVLSELKNRSVQSKKLLDIGTGSGAILISILRYDNETVGSGIDISENALSQARKNADSNSVSDRCDFFVSDLFENINETYDIIISNPPYIETDVIETLSPQVKDYEPRRALDGGNDGLDFYRKIISGADRYLNKNGMIFFEIGFSQANAVKDLLTEHGFRDITIKKDLADLDRVVYASLKNAFS